VASQNIGKETKCTPKYGIRSRESDPSDNWSDLCFQWMILNKRNMLVKGQFNVQEQSAFKEKNLSPLL